MGKSQGQGAIGRNRPPRVHIEYEVERYGANKKVDLPFVMGVMADLSGNPAEPPPPLEDRKFSSVDAENFDAYLKSTKPRVSFQVPNKLTEEGGNLSVEITFDSMDDFTPGAIAKRVKGLDKLYEARQQLNVLLTDLDGKSNAQETLRKILSDDTLLKSLAAAHAQKEEAKKKSGNGE